MGRFRELDHLKSLAKDFFQKLKCLIFIWYSKATNYGLKLFLTIAFSHFLNCIVVEGRVDSE